MPHNVVRRVRSSALLLTAVLTTASAASAQVGFVAVDLTPAGYQSFRFSGADANGAVGTGSRLFAYNGGAYRIIEAFALDTVSNTLVNLSPPLPVNYSQTFGIKGGVQFGLTVQSNNDPDAPALDNAGTVWSGSAASAVLMTPDGNASSAVLGSNGSAFVGIARAFAETQSQAWYWGSASPASAQPLQLPSENDYVAPFASVATGVSGTRIVGTLFTDDDGRFALHWPDPNAAPEVISLGFETYGQDIQGNIALIDTADANRHANLYNLDTQQRTDLHPTSKPEVINTYGLKISGNTQVGIAAVQVVPESDPREHAVRWTGTAESYLDLHPALPAIFRTSGAYGVSADGSIFGDAGYSPSGDPQYTDYRGIRWVPGSVATGNFIFPVAPGPADYNDPARWNGVVPQGVGAIATFDNPGTSDIALTAPAGVTAGTLTFTSDQGNFSFDGPVTLTGYAGGHGALIVNQSTVSLPNVELTGTTDFVIDGGSIVNVGVVAGSGALQKLGYGTLLIGGSATGFSGLTYVQSGVLNVNVPLRTPARPLIVDGAQNVGLQPGIAVFSAPHSASAYTVAGEFSEILIDANAFVLVADRPGAGLLPSVLIASGVALHPDAFLDLADNDMIVRDGDVAQLQSYLQRFYGTENQRTFFGIGTSAAGSNPLVTIAVFDNETAPGIAYFASYDGIALSPSDVILKYTYFGDADLDGTVDGADLVSFIEGFSAGLTGWANGDFNYDGVVDAADYSLLRASLDAGPLTPLGDGSGVLASGGPIPEPSALAVLLPAAATLGRRRR